MRARGFSLLEVMVAVAIFAVIAVLAYGGLDAVTRARAQTAAAAQRLAALQFSVTTLEHDLREALPRPVRGAAGEQLPALVGTPSTLELTHAGFASPLTEVSAMLARNAWSLGDDGLQRARWAVLDRAPDSRPIRRTVLEGATRLRLRYMARNGQWRDTWPPRDGPEAALDSLPRAVEFALDGDDFGHVERRVELVAPATTVGEP